MAAGALKSVERVTSNSFLDVLIILVKPWAETNGGLLCTQRLQFMGQRDAMSYAYLHRVWGGRGLTEILNSAQMGLAGCAGFSVQNPVWYREYLLY